MKPIISYLGIAVLGAAAAAGVVLAADRTPTAGANDRAAIEAVVRDYILAHPEIIPQAMQRLEEKQLAAAISENRAAIETPFPGAVAGNPAGDVTLVEYFDYACGYCRASLPDLDRLIAADPRLRVVFRELPILSEASETAAKVSLAAAKQGKFLAFHHALYKLGTPTAEKIAEAGRAAGLSANLTATQSGGADVAAEIQTNLEIARAVRFSGTPTFVIGDKVLSGALGYDALKAAVAEARAAKAG